MGNSVKNIQYGYFQMSVLLLILVGAGYPLTGLGIDWGSAYSDGTFIFIETAELGSHTDNSSQEFPFLT